MKNENDEQRDVTCALCGGARGVLLAAHTPDSLSSAWTFWPIKCPQCNADGAAGIEPRAVENAVFTHAPFFRDKPCVRPWNQGGEASLGEAAST